MSINKDAVVIIELNSISRKEAFSIAKEQFKIKRQQGMSLLDKLKIYQSPLFDSLNKVVSESLEAMTDDEKTVFFEMQRILFYGFEPLTDENRIMSIDGVIFLDNFK